MNSNPIEKTGARMSIRGAISKLAIGLCCLAIIGLAGTSGARVYNTASAEQAAIAQADMHEERILARTVGEPAENEWDWEVSTDSLAAD